MSSSALSPLLRYFANQTQAALDRLYADGWTCQGLLRALPPVARLYALRFACAQGDVPVKVVEAWVQVGNSAARTKHEHALFVLDRLKLLAKAGEKCKAEAKKLEAKKLKREKLML